MSRLKSARPSPHENGENEQLIGHNQPQREPLKFNVDTTNLPPLLAELVLEIQQTAESTLFHWKTFPLCPPPPLAIQELSEGSASTRRRPLVVGNLFDLPSWDDLDTVSVDRQGEAKRLSGKQLATVRKQGHSEKSGSWRNLTVDQLRSVSQSGTFTVPSSNFPGQHHTWRLSPLVQKGTEPTMEDFLKALAWSTALLRMTAAERFYGDTFSLRRSAQSLKSGLHSLLDLLFGMPSLQPRDFEARLHEERSRYLVAELLCAVHCQEEYIALCRFIRHLVANQRPTSGRLAWDLRQLKAPPLPYIFQTPKGQIIDLRLFSKEVMDKVKPVINSVLQSQSKTRWSHHQKAEEMKSAEAGCVEEEEETQVLQRLWSILIQNPDLGTGLGQLLVDQARASLAMKQSVGRVRERFTADLIQAEVDLRLRHPLLSLVHPWMQKRLQEVKIRLIEEYQWKCHEEAIEACRLKSLDQFVYFLSRDLAFLRDRAPMLSKELLADKQATRTFLWDTWIWNPRSWIIRRHFQGSTEIISTHISPTPTSITTPRTEQSSSGHQDQPVYTVERSSRRSTATQWPLWRWTNFLQRAWSWSWNGAYACGYLVPWCSPIGLRALLSQQPFYADLELSQVNGALCPARSAYTPTLSSRLASLWRHISKSRTEFETQPDTGFVGKGLSRQVNRVWNYGCKGLLCSLLLLIFFPAVCFLCSLGGMCLAVTAPIWAPVLALLYHLFIILIWDVDNPDPVNRRGPIKHLFPMIRVIGWDVLVLGFLQPVACLGISFIVCPILALLLSLFGVLRWTLTRTRDSLVYQLIIRPRSRVPAAEGCLVRRIAGPGLDADFYYQISKEQALAALEARLEADRLLAYRRQTERLIRRPAEEFRTFVQQVFSPFAGSPWLLMASTPVTPAHTATATADKISDKTVDPTGLPSSGIPKSGNVAAQLERETQALLASLEEKVERRLYELRMPLPANVLKKIRLSSNDLKMVLVRSAALIRSFYPNEVLARLGVQQTELWERYNVEEGDWLALAAIFLGEIFNPAILNPLAESDTRVQLETKDANLSRYTAMLSQTELDASASGIASAVEPLEWSLRALLPSQQSVLLPDFSCFSPLARDAAQSSPPWKKKRTHQQSAGRLSAIPKWSTGGMTSSSSRLIGTGIRGSASGPDSNRHQTIGRCDLLIPLPVPHPIIICLLIYNRHRDIGAIPLESEACRILIRYLEGGANAGSTRNKEVIARPPTLLDAGGGAGGASRSPASHKPLLGSSGSDLATNLSQPSLAEEYSVEDGSGSLSQAHDTLVSIAQDGTLSLVGTLMSEHASVVDLELDQETMAQNLSGTTITVNTTGSGPKSGLGTTLARAADTLRAAFLGEKAEDGQLSGQQGANSRKFSGSENFELLPSNDDHLEEGHLDEATGHSIESAISQQQSDFGAKSGSRKFPSYQPATFKSWRMNLPSQLRYDVSSETKPKAGTGGPNSPRPLGLFELSSGLSQDRGPAFSPAQFSIGRRLMESGGNVLTASSSQDSLPFAEEDASLVDTPDFGWPDASSRRSSGPHSVGRRNPQSSSRALGQPYCEMQLPQRPSAAVLASIEDLSVSVDSSMQHTHLDITSKLGTQV